MFMVGQMTIFVEIRYMVVEAISTNSSLAPALAEVGPGLRLRIDYFQYKENGVKHSP